MIQGHGYESARILLVGDSGSEEDVNIGFALSGLSERVLKGFCHDNQIPWTDVYRTLLIKERGNQSKPIINEPLVTDQYKMILENEIKSIGPRVVVPLSELSFKFITGLSGIRKYRGSVLPPRGDFPSNNFRVIPILGPNPYLNEDYSLHFISRLDFSKVLKNVDRTEPIREIGNCWIAKTPGVFRNFLNRSYPGASYLVFDIETFCGIPTCISFCFDGNESVTVPLLDYNIDINDRLLLFELVIEVLNSPIPKVNQNIKFDWHHLEQFMVKVNNVKGDTALAANCLYCEFPKNLGFLTSIYTEMPYHKDEGKQFDPTINNRDKLYLYCAKDSLATHKIYSQQQEEIKELGVGYVYNKLIEILPLYKRMEDVGMRIDAQEKEKLILKYESFYDIQQLKLNYLVGTVTNPESDDQIRKLVYDEMGYKAVRGVKRTKTGKLGVDEETLELLLWMGRAENSYRWECEQIIKAIISCRKIHKVLEFLNAPIHPDGRIRCDFNLGGAETGRTTTGKTTDNLLIFDRKTKKGKVKRVDLGRSFQNIGKHGFEVDGENLGRDLRNIFVPDRGYCFVENDLSQAEARVDAVLAKDYDILTVFDGKTGIHRLTGSWIYDCPPEEIKKNVLVNGVERYLEAKTARHAGERGMREDRLMMMIHQPIARCIQILKIFHNKQPNIRGVFHREIEENIRLHRRLVAPNGRRRDFFGRFDHHTVNEGISFLPQAIVTDYMKDGLWKTFEECDYAIPLNEQHDGFLAQVPLDKKEEYALTFKRNTVKPIDFSTCSLSRDFQLTIPMESEWSDTTWAQMKDLKA